MPGLDDLEAWAAEARAREAADARARERWLRTQAEEGAQLAQVLAGLVEQRAVVAVTTSAGRTVTGRLATLGRDFVAVAAPGGRLTLVALHAVAWVRPSERRRDPVVGPEPEDEGGDASGAGLIDVLAQAVADRPRVAVETEHAGITGELRAVGIDLVVIEIPGSQRGLAYVRLGSVYEISFLDSG